MGLITSLSTWRWRKLAKKRLRDDLASSPAKAVERHSRFETMEPRCLFNVDPIWVGGVYIEADQGSDLHGDDFYISFDGGAQNTQLTKLTIDLDQNAPGIGVADNIFDLSEGGLGADQAYNFKVEQIVAKDPRARVTARVTDGGFKLILEFQHFYAGDRLYFSVDVDEVQHFDPNERDQNEINLGLDPITSGVEFQGSKFHASFSAQHYEDIEGSSIFQNRYDSILAPSGLDLPADNDNGLRDRTAGTAFTVTQIPKPVTLSGVVYVDNNLNLVQDGGEQGLSSVQLELFRKEGSQFVSTGHRTTTDVQGRYVFGQNLNLKPGTYEIREAQPTGYFSVGATPGRIDGATAVGQTVPNNPDVLTQIVVPLGDQHARELNFAEAQPTSIRGFVYQDRDNDGLRDPGETGIGGIDIRLEAIDTITGPKTFTTVTQADGSYRFDGLPPGVYRVVEAEQPAGFFDGKDTPGTVSGATRGRSLINDAITEIALFGNDLGIEYNFGELPPSTLSGHVCIATPGYDCFSSDPRGIEPLPGVRVDLVDERGEIVATTYSANDGSYRFDGLPAGTYTIVETTPEGVIDGDSRSGSIDGRVVGDDTDPNRITQIILGAGVDGINYDFCELLPGTISGHVFEDRNDDGVRAADEPLIGGVLVTLYDEDGEEIDSTITDSSGFYRFTHLRPGAYRLVETTPDGYLDGQDIAGTIRGTTVGVVDSDSDTISAIVLPSGLDGVNYDFGELRAASISGRVIVDSNGNCILDAELDRPLPGVIIELIDERGEVVEITFTDDDGRYVFENILPGRYSIRETQPDGLHQQASHVGNGSGRTDGPDNIVDIDISSGDVLINYNFCEAPPAVISGYVFQDGPILVTTDGVAPYPIRPVRDGVRDENDMPIGGVTIELRSTSGQIVASSEALPGSYSGNLIVVTTDENGYFEFRGLKAGTYHIYQRHPVGFTDGLDTAGTTGGTALNAEDAINDAQTQALLALLQSSSSTDPGVDAILNVLALAGRESIENNFSELRIGVEKPPEEPPEPVPPIDRPPSNFVPPPNNGFATLPFDRVLPPPVAIPYAPPPLFGGGAGEYAWHLSVINAGMPRGSLAGKKLTLDQLARATKVLDVGNWTLSRQGDAEWTFVSTKPNMSALRVSRQTFDIDGAISLAGDFNGDAKDELALFLNGEWLIDINGNGRWDGEDIWAKLGDPGDRPVIGDWDGDGKDDIGIYGPEWPGDDELIMNEPGLPDPQNFTVSRPKNVPPESKGNTEQLRLMQRSSRGPSRADVIDHVFRMGGNDDQPIAGDFNGDGIASIGVFRAGKWRLDTNGDGRWTNGVDLNFEFGQAGDIAVVGDFDGDGIEEVAVLRGDRLIVDSNRNHKFDSTDLVLSIQGRPEDVVIGDFDGDGKDEPAMIHRGRSSQGALLRQAQKDS